MSRFKKGQQVLLRNYSGSVNEETRYEIRSCGSKQAILDLLSFQPDGQWVKITSRGRMILLNSQAQFDRYVSQGMSTRHLRTDWKQVFVRPRENGWDADSN